MTHEVTHCALCSKEFKKTDLTLLKGDPLHAFPGALAQVISDLAIANGTPLSIRTLEGDKNLYPLGFHASCLVAAAQEIMEFAQTNEVDPRTLGFKVDTDSELGDEISDEQANSALSMEKDFLDPERVIAELDKYVIGQEKAKGVLALAISDHLKRLGIIDRDESSGGLIPSKSNVLLVGPSGVGKTELAMYAAQILMVPFISISATELSPTGMKGMDTTEVLARLLEVAKGDPSYAGSGIIFVDEVDKIRRAAPDDSVVDSVRGSGVQQMLLKFIEGTSADIIVDPVTRQTASVHTQDILFIFAGAFDGLAEMIAKKNKTATCIGFGAQVESKDSHEVEFPEHIEPEHLLMWGFSKEFVGRLPFVATLKTLTEDDLVRILTETKGALVKQFQALTAEDGVKLKFNPEAIRALAHAALTKKVGARGLRSMMEQALAPTRLSLRRKKRENPSLTEVHITEGVIIHGDPAEYINTPREKLISEATRRVLARGKLAGEA